MARARQEKTNYPWAVEKLGKPMSLTRRIINSTAMGGLGATAGASFGMIAGREIPQSFATTLQPLVIDTHTIIPSMAFDNASIGGIIGGALVAAFGITFTAIMLNKRNENIAKENKNVVQRNRQSILSYYSSNDITIPDQLVVLLPELLQIKPR